MNRAEIVASIKKLADEYACKGDHDNDQVANAFYRLAEIIENAECGA